MEENSKINIKNNNSIYTLEETLNPLMFQTIMNQSINKKRDTALSKEIIKRKKIIYDLYQKAGLNYLEQKPESLNQFQSLLGKYLSSFCFENG